MTSRLDTLVIDANAPFPLARFWAELLGWNLRDEGDGDWVLVPTDGTRFELLVEPVPEPKVGKNRIHLDLTSTSLDDQTLVAAVARARRSPHRRRTDPGRQARRARRSRGQRVLRHRAGEHVPRRLRALGSSRATAHPRSGHFWSAALGWPLVWDQDDETAIRAPDGTGPFITWGPPLPPKRGKNRLHLDIAPPSTSISTPRSNASSRSARAASTSGRATSRGS